MSEMIRGRRAMRQRLELADATIESWDTDARRKRGDAVPPIEAPTENLAACSTAEITVNVEWLAYMLGYAQDTGEGLDRDGA